MTPDYLRRARDCFDAALEEEPRYAAASVALAECYCFMARWGSPPHDVMPKAKQLAQAAIEDDESSAEAYAVLGFVESAYEWDWVCAEGHFQRAIGLDARSLSVRCWYGDYLATVGRIGEALRETRKAQELEPASILVNAHAAKMLYSARRYGDAKELLLSVCEEAPGLFVTHWYLGLTLLETASPRLALESLERAAELAGDCPSLLGAIGYARAVDGDIAGALESIGRLEQLARTAQVPAIDFAIVYMGLGDSDRAFELLDEAMEERALFLSWLPVWPLFDGLRSDPRYAGLLERMNLKAKSRLESAQSEL